MDAATVVNKVLAIATLLAQVGVVVSLVYLLFFHKKNYAIFQLIGKHGMKLAFKIALIATLGSLFYSEVAGFNPCVLCWYQRIFMYPLVALFIVAFKKKQSQIVDYILSLSVVGFLISLYHNILYYTNGGVPVPCEAGGTSCMKIYVMELGYITIPMMALTAFAAIIISLILYKNYQKSISN